MCKNTLATLSKPTAYTAPPRTPTGRHHSGLCWERAYVVVVVAHRHGEAVGARDGQSVLQSHRLSRWAVPGTPGMEHRVGGLEKKVDLVKKSPPVMYHDLHNFWKVVIYDFKHAQHNCY